MNDIPEVEWNDEGNNLDEEYISELKPNDTPDGMWYSLEELEEQGWIEENTGEPFYPVPKSSGKIVIDGNHRVSYAQIKGEKKVKVEKPTKIEIKLDDGREKTINSWDNIQRNGENTPSTTENRIRQLVDDCDNGKVEKAQIQDGPIICTSSDYNG